MNGGPPNKWSKVSTDTSSDDVLAALNNLAKSQPPTVAVEATCTDGNFIFVGSYPEGGNSQ